MAVVLRQPLDKRQALVADQEAVLAQQSPLYRRGWWWDGRLWISVGEEDVRLDSSCRVGGGAAVDAAAGPAHVPPRVWRVARAAFPRGQGPWAWEPLPGTLAGFDGAAGSPGEWLAHQRQAD